MKFKRSTLRLVAIFTFFFFLFSLTGIAIFPTISYADTMTTIYASPNGLDTNTGMTYTSPVTLTKARDLVRANNTNMSGDIIVYLLQGSGSYTLSSTFELDEKDSGTNGFRVIYKAYPGESPVISGGIKLTGWTQVPGRSFYQATVSPGINYKIRNLFVNGNRAQIAKHSNLVYGQGGYGYNGGLPTGIKFKNSDLPNLTNVDDVEVEKSVAWQHMILCASALETIGEYKVLQMQEPYFKLGLGQCVFHAPLMGKYNESSGTALSYNAGVAYSIRNAYEFLDSPGEFYYNRHTNTMYYYPKPGENMTTAEVYAPILEGELIRVKGNNVYNKAHNIEFQGITFSHNAWNLVEYSGSRGLMIAQANQALKCFPNEVANAGFEHFATIPASIHVENANYIDIVGNTFKNIGTSAINLVNGVSYCSIVGNFFADISGSAVSVGDGTHNNVNDSLKFVQDEVCKHNVVKNNFINKTGVEFISTPAIIAYYVDDLEISHNNISDCGYSGISLGWGWSITQNSTTSKNNKVLNNDISNVMHTMNDGGGIYTVGQMPDTIVSGNYIHNLKDVHTYAIYPDEGSAYITFKNNVCEDLGSDIYRIHLWNGNIWYNVFDNNYSTVTKYVNNATESDEKNTTIYQQNSPPQEVTEIKNNSGLQAPFKFLLGKISPTPSPTATPTPAGTNLAYQKSATASSIEPSGWFNPDKAFDNNTNSGWAPQGDDVFPYLQVDLGGYCQINCIEFVSRQDADQPMTRQCFEVLASNSEDFSSYVVLGKQGYDPFPYQGTWTKNVNDSGCYRYVRFRKNNEVPSYCNPYMFVNELRVWGVQTSPAPTPTSTPTPMPIPTPFGTELASGKPIFANSSAGYDYSADRANDGNTGTSWRNNWGYGNLTIDLKGYCRISKIEIVPNQSDDQIDTRRNFDIKASNDADFANAVTLGGQGNIAFPHQQTWVLNVNDTNTYRYIHLQKNAQERMHVAEIKVYGQEITPLTATPTPTPTPTVTPTPTPYGSNLSPGKTVIASSSCTDGGYTYGPGNSIDNNSMTSWISDYDRNTDPSPWLKIDLGSAYNVRNIELVTRQDVDQPDSRRNFVIEASNVSDFSTYTTLYTRGSTPIPYQGTLRVDLSGTDTYRYIRVKKTVTNESLVINEFKVYGFRLLPTPTPTPFGINIAMNKTATASSVYSDGGYTWAAGNGNDGNTNTGWSPVGGEPTLWWQVDLGDNYILSRFELKDREDVDQPDIRRNFEIRASNSSDFSSYVTLYSQGSTPFEHKSTLAVGVGDRNTYRYIRLVKTASNEYFFISEFRAFGDRPANTYPNVSQGKTASASSELTDGGYTYAAGNANDGSTSTGWSSSAGDTSSWWQVDLGNSYLIKGIDLVARPDADQAYTRKNFEIRASNSSDFSTYTILHIQQYTSFPHQGTLSIDVGNPKTYRYVRYVKTSADQYNFIDEFKVYGVTPAPTPTPTPTPTPVGTNILQGKTATGSTYYSGFPYYQANDGYVTGGNGWSAQAVTNDPYPWWQADLGGKYILNKVELYGRPDGDQPETRRNFAILASKWEDFREFIILGLQVNTAFPHQGTWESNSGNTAETYRYIRAVKTAKEYFFIPELKVYGITPTPSPTPVPLTCEAENLSTAVSSGDSHASSDDANMSNNKGDLFNASASGDYIEYSVNVTQTGIYNVKVKVRKNNSCGKYQLIVDGCYLGSEVDMYSASASYEEIDMGNILFTSPGIKLLRLKCNGKNVSSSDYDLFTDCMKLTKQ